MLAATVTVPIFGRLSDVYGRRRFFIAGIAIFMGGRGVGATSGSMTQLMILARASRASARARSYRSRSPRSATSSRRRTAGAGRD